MTDRHEKTRRSKALARAAMGGAAGFAAAFLTASAVAALLGSDARAQGGADGIGDIIERLRDDAARPQEPATPADPLADALSKCESGARGDGAPAGALAGCDDALQSGALSDAVRAGALANLAELSLRAGDASTARSDLAEAAELAPPNGAIRVNLAAAGIRARDFAAAETAAREALTIKGAHQGEAWFNLAVALERQGDFDAAYEAYAEAAALQPDNAVFAAQPRRFRRHSGDGA